MKTLLALLFAAAAFGQESAAPAVGTVSNSFTLFAETLTSRNVQLQVTVTTVYPDTLAEDQYPDFVNVAADVQGFLRGASKAVALEAVAASALLQTVRKYPQMSGVSIEFINQGGSIQVSATRVAATAQKAAVLDELRQAMRSRRAQAGAPR